MAGDYISYMTGNDKLVRRVIWKDFNFAGTIDWAVDLQQFRNEDFDAPQIFQSRGQSVGEVKTTRTMVGTCATSLVDTASALNRSAPALKKGSLRSCRRSRTGTRSWQMTPSMSI
jgi:hypothetical protein